MPLAAYTHYTLLSLAQCALAQHAPQLTGAVLLVYATMLPQMPVACGSKDYVGGGILDLLGGAWGPFYVQPQHVHQIMMYMI